MMRSFRTFSITHCNKIFTTYLFFQRFFSSSLLTLRAITIMTNIIHIVVSTFANSLNFENFNIKYQNIFIFIIKILRIRALNKFITSMKISSDRARTLIVMIIILNKSIVRNYLDNWTKNLNVEKKILIMIKIKILNYCFNDWREHITNVIDVLRDLKLVMKNTWKRGVKFNEWSRKENEKRRRYKL